MADLLTLLPNSFEELVSLDNLDNSSFENKLNQVRHEFEIYLDNGAGETDKSKYPINPNSIVNLNIEDTLADWVVKGNITFMFNPEAGSKVAISQETGAEVKATTGLSENIEVKKPYVFRNDGNDILRIKIKPLLDNSLEGVEALNVSDPVHWTISYRFSIYDAEDIDLPPGAQNQASNTIKCIKLYFWDEWYQKMITNVMEYSTAEDSDFTQADANGEYANGAVVKTGKAMKSIIEKALKNVDSTDGAPIDDSMWEEGACDIFYTTPAQTTAYDSLMYIYDKHISSVEKTQNQNDFSLLRIDRGPTEDSVGRFTLQPFSKIFEKAGKETTSPGEYQIEHFFLQAYDSASNNPSKTFLAPTGDGTSDKIDLQTSKYSTIQNYRFVDISSATNTLLFTNSPVYSFDFKNRTFNAEFKNNSVKTAREFIAKKYIDNVYKNTGSPLEDLFLVTLDKDKESKNTRPAFSLYGDDPKIRQHAGLQKLLYLGIFQNACINFRTLGLTSREAGRFIGIDKIQGVEHDDFPDKFYGQWLIINIKHIIESEMYYNDITAIKVHRFQELSTTFNNTI